MKIEFWTFGHEDVWVSWVSWVSAWVVDWLARSVMGEGSWRPWPFAIPHCSILVAHPLGLEDETNTGINVELRSLAEKKIPEEHGRVGPLPLAWDEDATGKRGQQ